jgi:uncharacterized protein YbjT (DUF2867 family)
MKVVLFGATGMVGSGALRECLLDPDVEAVLTVGRAPTGQSHAKLRELVHKDMHDFSAVAGELAGYDACFFCLGITSAGMTEADYKRITYDIALAAANTLVEKNPDMTFIFVSGGGTDASEQGRSMWARVKGQTENAIARLPFKATYMFRPAIIQPLHGSQSKTTSYRILYAVFAPLMWLLKVTWPSIITTTERVGRAMLEVAKRGSTRHILENRDINEIAVPLLAPR